MEWTEHGNLFISFVYDVMSKSPIDRSVTKGHLITRPHLQACQSKIFQRWRQHFICCRWVVIIEAIRNCVRVDVRSHLVQREESLDFYPVKNRVERFCVAEEKQCACVYVCVRESRDTRCIDKENTQDLEMYIHKGERLNIIQCGRRVLYIVTLSLH